ncbi:GPI transamidase component PIG-T isoform X2 [Ricinus communis]|nr:GPI transamidase component PIG-T isoform X2 [Ricinus communis]|eukprot:XP_015575968.1 GPI transamidase component PIG-T isoform X2 [Ricinus communis]
MELSFTQGRWNYESWGGFDPISSTNAKPPGVELWAVFDVPHDQVDASWKSLTHTLSGLFCASINFLESSSLYAAPEWSFRPATGNIRYGMLPREAVCTENLTPWLKLLPCRDKAGISALMDRPSLYRGFYHSQRLHLTSNKSGPEGKNSGIILEQSLTIVLQPYSYSSAKNFQPSWSLSSILGRKITGSCDLAKSSNVYLQFESNLVTELKKIENNGVVDIASGGIWGPGFELSVKPDMVFEEENSRHRKGSSVFYKFSVDKYSDSQPFDLGLTWKYPVTWSCEQAPLHASRFLMGSGNERGAIAILLKSTDISDASLGTSCATGGNKLRVDVFQVVPWYVKVYYHTLQLFVNDQPKAVGDFIVKIHVSPSKDKISPGVMEMVLQLPCDVKSATLTLEFDKGFLHIDEYPPDANQGFDIPSAAISFPNFYTSKIFPSNCSVEKSPMLSKFQEKNPVLAYTEVLLVPLTTPDFSMPYNVITITCTVFALYFGSLLNVLRRRVAEEERLLKKKADEKTSWLSKLSAKLRGKPQDNPESQQETSELRREALESPSKSSSLINSKLLLKIMLVAGFAVAWQYYFG